MFVTILFGASVLLSGLFLALPETFASIANYGGDSFNVSRIVGILVVFFEARWIIRRIKNK
ncbi:MAG: hypothetical protein Q8P06_00520 [Candidatus Azambacteria bacterium]|nr:hypothetical protein [Candidatus Azambacteria bacterium]